MSSFSKGFNSTGMNRYQLEAEKAKRERTAYMQGEAKKAVAEFIATMRQHGVALTPVLRPDGRTVVYHAWPAKDPTYISGENFYTPGRAILPSGLEIDVDYHPNGNSNPGHSMSVDLLCTWRRRLHANGNPVSESAFVPQQTLGDSWTMENIVKLGVQARRLITGST